MQDTKNYLSMESFAVVDPFSSAAFTKTAHSALSPTEAGMYPATSSMLPTP
jgi:hypothetical protein